MAVAVKGVAALHGWIGHLYAGVKNTGSVRTVIEVLGAISIEIALDASFVRVVAERGWTVARSARRTRSAEAILWNRARIKIVRTAATHPALHRGHTRTSRHRPAVAGFADDIRTIDAEVRR